MRGRSRLVHWGFAVFGGVCSLVFIAAASPLKPAITLLPVLPPVIWTGMVFARAHRGGVAT